jgi:hypothetical protein
MIGMNSEGQYGSLSAHCSDEGGLHGLGRACVRARARAQHQQPPQSPCTAIGTAAARWAAGLLSKIAFTRQSECIEQHER